MNVLPDEPTPYRDLVRVLARAPVSIGRNRFEVVEKNSTASLVSHRGYLTA